jgi:hypothetical protein
MANKKSAADVHAVPKSQLVIYDCQQGTDEWRMLRLGIPTASNFSTIMANGRDGGPSVTRTKLLHRLAAELITGEPGSEGFRNGAMDKGNALEAEARDSYARRKKALVRQVGFVKNFSGLKQCGASPDGLIGFDGGLEIKIATEAHILIPMLQRPASMPAEHRCQIQGNIWVCDRSWWDLTIYHHHAMPAVDVRVYRDDAFIKNLSNEVERFNYELLRLTESIKKMGQAG